MPKFRDKYTRLSSSLKKNDDDFAVCLSLHLNCFGNSIYELKAIISISIELKSSRNRRFTGMREGSMSNNFMYYQTDGIRLI